VLLVKLTRTEDGRIKAETPRRVIGYFSDMDEHDVAAYLVQQAQAIGESIRFVDEFEPQEEHIDYSRLMKRRF